MFKPLTKQQLLHTEKTSEFIKAIKTLGYTLNRNSSGSHVVYSCTGKPNITIVDGGHKVLSIGVRRQISNILDPYLQ
jgi:predicted RNA binding protein YcfA (HicA-like mRNA interferase family)